LPGVREGSNRQLAVPNLWSGALRDVPTQLRLLPGVWERSAIGARFAPKQGVGRNVTRRSDANLRLLLLQPH